MRQVLPINVSCDDSIIEGLGEGEVEPDFIGEFICWATVTAWSDQVHFGGDHFGGFRCGYVEGVGGAGAFFG